MKKSRKFSDLVSVGPATLKDFELLGIDSVEQLVGRDATELYKRLQEIVGDKFDICCQDVFRAAIEQANNPNLPDEKQKWYYWSRQRKL